MHDCEFGRLVCSNQYLSGVGSLRRQAQSMVRLHAPDLDVSERIYLGVVAENEFAMMDVVSEYLYSQKEESNKKAYRKSYVSRYAHE